MARYSLNRRVRLVVSLVLAASAHTASAQSFAPQNLAPNSQWEIWSAVGYSRAQNIAGTAEVAPIAATDNSVGTSGASTFTVATTGELKVGDLVTVSGTGVDPAFLVSPMRVTALTSTSISVRIPQGLRPKLHGNATITPIVIGNSAAKNTGAAADGWTKSLSMPIWRENNQVNIAQGAYYSIGMVKDLAEAEQFYLLPDVRKFAGKTIVFGILGYQKVRTSAGTWRIFFNDSVYGVRYCTLVPVPVTNGFQWSECSVPIAPGTTYVYVGVDLQGATNDTYYFSNPVLALGGSVGGAQNYVKPHERLFPTVHMSPYGWVDRTIVFPTVLNNAAYQFTMDPYAETGGGIAPTVQQAWGQLEGIDDGAVQVGTGSTRSMAWFDRFQAGPIHSGSFLSQYVQNVKSYSYMYYPLNTYDATPDMVGTGAFATNLPGDTWTNVSLEFDEFDLR